MPYSQPGANLLDDMIARMNAERLAFVVHVGDITSGRGPCGDAWLEARQKQFAAFRAPFVLLPGDNEWLDCGRTGFQPRERLEKWRQLFCFSDSRINLVRQDNEFCENVRWEHAGYVFAGVNVPGGNNNLADAAEHAARMRAVNAWLDAAEALAHRREGLVLVMHANPFLRRPSNADGYRDVRERLRRLGREMPGRVLLAHGDTHAFRDDEPLPGLRRTEVYGWPHIRWTKASLRPGAPRFRIESMP